MGPMGDPLGPKAQQHAHRVPNSGQRFVDQRRTARTALRLPATAYVPGRGKVPVKIIDLSPYGCRLQMLHGPFVEQWILVGIAGLTPQCSRVVWQQDGFAGVEFATPLSQAVFNSLLADETISEGTIKALRDVAAHAHRLAQVAAQSPHRQALFGLSQDCSVAAVVHALRLGETHEEPAHAGSLMATMIRTGPHSPELTKEG